MNKNGHRGIAVVLAVTLFFPVFVFSSNSAKAETVNLDSLLGHVKVGWLKLASVEATHVVKDLESADTELLAFSGLILSASGQLDQARQAYFEIINSEDLTPAVEGSYYTLIAKTYLAEQNFDAAKDYYTKALKLTGDEVVGLVDLGIISLRQGNLDSAKAYLSRAEKVDQTGYPRLSIAQGDLARAQGDRNGALDLYKQALQQSPTDSETYGKMRQIYQELGESKKEEELLKQAQEAGIRLTE